MVRHYRRGAHAPSQACFCSPDPPWRIPSGSDPWRGESVLSRGLLQLLRGAGRERALLQVGRGKIPEVWALATGQTRVTSLDPGDRTRGQARPLGNGPAPRAGKAARSDKTPPAGTTPAQWRSLQSLPVGGDRLKLPAKNLFKLFDRLIYETSLTLDVELQLVSCIPHEQNRRATTSPGISDLKVYVWIRGCQIRNDKGCAGYTLLYPLHHITNKTRQVSSLAEEPGRLHRTLYSIVKNILHRICKGHRNENTRLRRGIVTGSPERIPWLLCEAIQGLSPHTVDDTPWNNRIESFL